MTDRLKSKGFPGDEAKPQETRQVPGGAFHGYLDGVRAFCEGDYEGARRRFNAVLVTDTHNPPLWAAVGHCHLHEGDREKALECYARAEKPGGQLPEVDYNRALLFARDQLWAAAYPLLKNLFQAPPPVQPRAFYLGLLFSSQDDMLCDVALYLGQACRALGRNGEARDWLEVAIEKRPDNVTAHQRLAELAILSKHYVVAINHLQVVLEKSPLDEDKIFAHNNLGIACYENGQLDEAIGHLTWVLRHSPGDPTAIHNLNFIYEREGIFEKEGRTPHSIRFMDVREGASPIFGLMGAGERSEGEVTVIGKSSEMLRVMRHARVAAASDSPVLIQGENGTGKELIAQVIALNSSRRDGPFMVVNCASMPELLLESELFGHEKGAFTGARARKTGVLEIGERGTVFLDEVTALTPMLQGRLLRAVRERRFIPLGGMRPVAMDVRLIAATNRDLENLVKSVEFREDLYYELKVLPIEIPPLRERREDIPLLVEHFLRRYSRNPQSQAVKMTEDDLQILTDYDWPGNVRELENLMARAVVMGTQSSLYLEELARLRRDRATSRKEKSRESSEVRYPVDITLADLEKRHILRVLDIHSNNQRQAAKILGINPSTLWRKLKGYDGPPEE